jgi:CheY-like chemotaxis protein
MKKALNTHQFANMNTLVLEKSGANMNLIDSYLNAFGMHFELTSSEMRAVAMLEGSNTVFAKPFDLLIVDYNTPSEGGFHFIEQLRNNNKIPKMPKIIMLLPLMKEDLFDRLKSHAIDAGIEKPVIPSILLNTIVDIFHLKAITSVRMETKKETPQWVRSIKVLLVEDNKTNQLIASSLLKQANIDTLIADDGKIAVEMFQEHENEIDLILMDLHMPVMNGYEASTLIRQQSEKIPILAMTADVIMGVKEKCEACGIHHYISKPFDPERFIATIVEIIQNNLASESQPVLNLDKGIKNLGGNHALYREVLQIYLQENQVRK